MKFSFSNVALIRDIKWIVLTLAIGISGQFFLSNPILILTPKLPMLSQQDWPRSQVASELEILRNLQQPKRREYLIRMQITEKLFYNPKAEIKQKTTWYEYTDLAATAMQKRKSELNMLPIIAESSLSPDTPASILLCRNTYKAFVCEYLAYWNYWFTEVHFSSEGDESLSFSEIQQIVTRVDELLMAAPDKP